MTVQQQSIRTLCIPVASVHLTKSSSEHSCAPGRTFGDGRSTFT